MLWLHVALRWAVLFDQHYKSAWLATRIACRLAPEAEKYPVARVVICVGHIGFSILAAHGRVGEVVCHGVTPKNTAITGQNIALTATPPSAARIRPGQAVMASPGAGEVASSGLVPKRHNPNQSSHIFYTNAEPQHRLDSLWQRIQ